MKQYIITLIACIPYLSTTQPDIHKLLQTQEEVTKQLQQNDQNKKKAFNVSNATQLTAMSLGVLGTYKEYLPEKIQVIGNATSNVPSNITAQIVKDFIQENNLDTVFYAKKLPNLPFLRHVTFELSTKNIAALLCTSNSLTLLTKETNNRPLINIGPIQLYSEQRDKIIFGYRHYNKAAPVYCNKIYRNTSNTSANELLLLSQKLFCQRIVSLEQKDRDYLHNYAVDTVARSAATVGYSLTNHALVKFAEELGIDETYTNLFFAADKNSTKGMQQLTEWLITEGYIRLITNLLEKHNCYRT